MIEKQIVLNISSEDKSRVDCFIARLNSFVRDCNNKFNVSDEPAPNHLWISKTISSIPERFIELEEHPVFGSNVPSEEMDVVVFETLKVR